MIILAIETACDDTGVAIVRNGHDILANVVETDFSSNILHGGVVPEVAARAHVQNFRPAVERAFQDAQVDFDDIDAVAVNNRHGLLRSVAVGVAGAKGLAMGLGVPIVPIHHIEGHVYSAMLERPDLEWPHVCLTVAGGHNLILHARRHGEYEILGRTLDDAAGEAYDKLARRLGLGFPGGKMVDQLAKLGDPTKFVFPRPLRSDGTCNFSFSGLKTAVTRVIDGFCESNTPVPVEDIAASFQEAVVDVLVEKSMAAASQVGASVLTATGGVSANSRLRERLAAAGQSADIEVVIPSPKYSTDNAAMIACAAHYRGLGAAVSSTSTFDASSNFPIGDLGARYSNKRVRNEAFDG